ncbi:MAG: DUF2953 domain-containing protein [Lachnospiraceae bacterium]|nr:DUF2953 domain-containing protein [Lachnospiraceae bacterium]
MSVVLLILKIIGIVLLSLIGLCILLMLLVFLWPFSYRVKAHKDAEVFNASARILWLLGLLTATVTYDGEAKLVIRVIGIPVYKMQLYPTEKKETADTEEDFLGDEETVPEDGSDVANAESSEIGENAVNSENTADDEVADKTVSSELEDNYVSENEFFDDSFEDSEMLSEEDIDREIEERLADTSEEDAFDKLPLGKKIKAFIRKIKELILKCRDKCYNIKGSIDDFIKKAKKKYKEAKYYYKLIQHPCIQPAIKKLWKVGKKLIKHMMPRRLKANIEFGSGDPASTMKVYGYYCMIYPFYGKHIKFTPDMENKVLNLDAKLTGRFQIFRMMWAGWTLFADRNIRKLIRLVRREVKRRDRK